MCKAVDAAEYLLNRSVEINGEAILSSPMIQKLLYIAQGHALHTQGVPLFSDNFVAWRCGPALRIVDFVYKRNLAGLLTPSYKPGLEQHERLTLDFVFDKYIDRSLSGVDLRDNLKNITRNSAPWKDIYEDGVEHVINNEEIRRWYSELFGRNVTCILSENAG